MWLAPQEGSGDLSPEEARTLREELDKLHPEVFGVRQEAA